MERDLKRIRKSIQRIEGMIKALVQVGKDQAEPSARDREAAVGRAAAAVAGSAASSGRAAAAAVDLEDLMTIREAYIELNVSRGTVDRLRQEGSLTSLYFNGGVRLLRSEVLAAKKWYSGMKGKV